MKKLILGACVCALVLTGAGQARAGDSAAAFEKLKTLAGDWETKMPDGNAVRANYRVTSAGSVVVETMMPGQPGEMVTEIQIPVLPPNTGAYFTKYSQMKGDYALASVAVLITLDKKKDVCANARIGLAGVGSTPLRAKKAEDVLKGKKITEALLAEAAEVAKTEINPVSGIEGSADYKRELAGTLLKRVGKEALARAQKA